MALVNSVPDQADVRRRGPATVELETPHVLPGGLCDAIAVVLYCALALLYFWKDWSGGLTQVTSGASDGLQMAWFLNWVPYALGHGLNPFHSGLASFPDGINLLNNTSAELLGLVMAPVTLLFGPVASLNVVVTLALAGSATSMYFVVRQFTEWRPAAFAAGLIVGFGPYVLGQTWHPFLTCYVLPPIILLLVHNLAVRNDGKARRRGITLGLLVAGQFFVSTEVLALTLIMAGVLLVVLAIRGRRSFASHLSGAVKSLCWAAGVAAVLLAYPAWYALRGPGHVTGFFSIPALYREDLLEPIVPDRLMQITAPSLVHTANHFASSVVENGGYLGITLLVTLIVGGLWLRRRADVQVVGIVGVVALVFSFGPRLMITGAPAALPDGSSAGQIPMPWALATHLPFFKDLLSSRFSAFVAMAAAFLLAVILDQVHGRVARQRRPLLAVITPAAIAVVALLPMLPAGVPFFDVAVPASSYFSSGFAHELPAGQVAVVYPYPSAYDNDAVLWQTEAGMRFALPGGYFYVPQLWPKGPAASGPFTLDTYPTNTGNALGAFFSGHPLPRSPAVRDAVRSELRSWRVGSVVAVPPNGRTASVVSYISWILGTRPVHQADAYVWYHVQEALAHG